MSTASLGLVVAAFFALGAAWLTGKTLATRASGTPTAQFAAQQQPAAARERIDLRQPLRSLATVHGATLAQRGIGLELAVPDAPLTVAAIAGDLSRLMAHIADTAATTLPNGSTLHVLARAEGHQAVVSLREAELSAGDAADVPPRLSLAFETGIGRPASPLAHACQAIAARHSARIYTAPSPLGDGCLTLRFPLHGARTARAPKGLL
ncbi:hypothetical protein [Variovorax sp. W6]|uniref:hypothetical protein n=1 Tax=Variovorax sp. W6 TaxID=3093895 RepID=UPI003D802761